MKQKYVRGDTPRRFWSYVEKGAPDECWTWTGALAQGYGVLWADRRSTRAHRWAYEDLVGPIPEGKELDHLCHTRDESCPGGHACTHRSCVNPAHLEPVTPRENTLRGRGIQATNARKTHCKYGHEFTPENTIIRSDGRECRTCRRRLAREWMAAKRATLRRIAS